MATGRDAGALSASMALRLREVTKAFGAFAALNPTDLDVPRGELLCVLGPSGCGKTTLLRVIAGLEAQTSGTIEIEGRDVTFEPPSARDFGIVFQSYALFPNLTVADNVGYGFVNRRWAKPDIAKRVAELLDLVGLADQGVKYPAQLSGGQQQRVALARAIATSPKLLLLDEPLSALDARVRETLRGEIRSLQKRLGITTIFVTHDQEEALTIADRIAVMNRGVIEQIGSPEETYSKPATAFVASFIGTMNRLSGIVRDASTVQLDGLEPAATAALRVSAQSAFKPGERVRLYVRPETIQVRNVGDATPNRLMATVRDIDFLGSFYRVALEIGASHAPTVVHVDLSANQIQEHSIALGSHLAIALPVEALHVFPAEGAALPVATDRPR